MFLDSPKRFFFAQRKHRDVTGCFPQKISPCKLQNFEELGSEIPGFQAEDSNHVDPAVAKHEHLERRSLSYHSMKWSRYNVWYHFVSFNVVFHVVSFQHVWYHLISLLYHLMSCHFIMFDIMSYHFKISEEIPSNAIQKNNGHVPSCSILTRVVTSAVASETWLKPMRKKNSVEAPSWFPLLEDRNWGKNQKKVQINPPWHYFSHLGKLTLKMMAWKFGISSSSPLF